MVDWDDEIKPREGHSGRVGLDRRLKDARRGDLQAVRRHLRDDPWLLTAKSRGHNRTLLWEAARGGREDIVAYLLDAGADPNVPGRTRSEIPLLLKPYCVARRYRHLAIATRLRERGTTLDLFSAVYLGDGERVREILDEGPYRLAREMDEDTVWRVTPLHYAVAAGHADLARWLIERGAPVRRYTRLLCTAAVRTGHPGLLPLLGETGADPALMRRWSS